jgi:hypothetical protein
VRAAERVVCLIHDVIDPFVVILVENTTTSFYLILNARYDMYVSAHIAGLSDNPVTLRENLLSDLLVRSRSR